MMNIQEEFKDIVSYNTEFLKQFFDNPTEISNKLIELFIITNTSASDLRFDLNIIPQEGMGAGKSIKVRNIFLDYKKLIIGGAEIILSSVGSIAIPWLIPFVGIVIANKLLKIMSIEINERHAVVFWILWKLRDDNNSVLKNKILNHINKILKKYQKQTMNNNELKRILNNLVKLKSIEIYNKKVIRIREKVKIEI